MTENQLSNPEDDMNKLFPKSPGQVILPFDEEHFKSFISGLLGHPQSISRTISGTFAIEIEDLKNLYYLIIQRVAQQNNGILLRFLTIIVFSDNSSVELNSLEALMTYNEVRPVIPRGLHMTWDFLVRFQDKEVAEKQSIDISFLTIDYERRKLGRLFLDQANAHFGALYYTKLSEMPSTGQGFANFRIEHTARTWGADLEALLSNHLNTLITEGSKLRVFLSKHRLAITLLTPFAFLLTVAVGAYFSLSRIQTDRILAFNALTQNAQTDIELVDAAYSGENDH